MKLTKRKPARFGAGLRFGADGPTGHSYLSERRIKDNPPYPRKNPQGTAGFTSANSAFSAVKSARWFFSGLVDLRDDRRDVQFFELFRGHGRRALGADLADAELGAGCYRVVMVCWLDGICRQRIIIIFHMTDQKYIRSS
jgi:hypothetical protein